jgi:dipeptidyl aminopeptidase/acylaminoacyl peptidase
LLFPESRGGAFNPNWSPDARFLAYQQDNPDTRVYDLWLLPLIGDRGPQPLLITDFAESTPRFSPDGKWIAYTSNESGAMEVYVRPVNQPAKLRVSTNGGANPVWRRDGKELFYGAQGVTIMAADKLPKCRCQGPVSQVQRRRGRPGVSRFRCDKRWEAIPLFLFRGGNETAVVDGGNRVDANSEMARCTPMTPDFAGNRR